MSFVKCNQSLVRLSDIVALELCHPSHPTQNNRDLFLIRITTQTQITHVLSFATKTQQILAFERIEKSLGM